MKHWYELNIADPELMKQMATAQLKTNTDRKTNIVYPSHDDIYKAFQLTDFDDIKVVILGQDPYHGPNQANGLAFSVNNGIALPPSLQNIFKELHDDIGNDLRTNPDLTDWAKQGILLMNSSLSVYAGQPNSMADVWSKVTDRLIYDIDRFSNHKIIFVLWGSYARSKKNLIKNGYVIESAHPSPLSAYRGFFGSKPFSKTNKLLTNMGTTPINWG